jgi:rubrerythrin
MRSLFSKKFLSSRKGIRLRHVLYLGSLMERQAEAFYRRFAKQAKDDDLKELYLKLADEEVQHFKLIDYQLSRWKSLPINKGDLEAMDANGKLRKMFLTPLDSKAEKNDIIEYAIDQETKMVEFYKSFENEFTGHWKSTRLQSMVGEEKRHIIKLKHMLSRLLAV